jgi:hypothetical protein
VTHLRRTMLEEIRGRKSLPRRRTRLQIRWLDAITGISQLPGSASSCAMLRWEHYRNSQGKQEVLCQKVEFVSVRGPRKSLKEMVDFAGNWSRAERAETKNDYIRSG